MSDLKKRVRILKRYMRLYPVPYRLVKYNPDVDFGHVILVDLDRNSECVSHLRKNGFPDESIIDKLTKKYGKDNLEDITKGRILLHLEKSLEALIVLIGDKNHGPFALLTLEFIFPTHEALQDWLIFNVAEKLVNQILAKLK